jgi:hypothetical protein
MITPPELRWQAQRLLSDAKRATDSTEEKILLDLALRLGDAASALERNETPARFERAPFVRRFGNHSK